MSSSQPHRVRPPLVPFLPFLVVSALHLAGQLADAEALAQGTKPLILTSLALALVWAVRWRLNRTVVLALCALGLGWCGDVALMLPGPTWFVVGLVAFLAGHLVFLYLFLRVLGHGRLPRPALLYLGCLALLLGVLWPHLGAMLVPATLYAIVIAAMAITATRCGALITWGAALFLVSDSLLAINRFVPDAGIVQAGFFIMVTYIAAQGLIVAGIVRSELTARVPAPTEAPAASR